MSSSIKYLLLNNVFKWKKHVLNKNPLSLNTIELWPLPPTRRYSGAVLALINGIMKFWKCPFSGMKTVKSGDLIVELNEP